MFCRTILKESGFARYLHSAVLINGAMLIFGGNTHNDTSLSNGAKCFSADFLSYDIGMYYTGFFFSHFGFKYHNFAFPIPANVILHSFDPKHLQVIYEFYRFLFNFA